jgi:hypothetical protein
LKTVPRGEESFSRIFTKISNILENSMKSNASKKKIIRVLNGKNGYSDA